LRQSESLPDAPWTSLPSAGPRFKAATFSVGSGRRGRVRTAAQ
jgi:hypothetical protein